MQTQYSVHNKVLMINTDLGLFTNFHLYQLIADKSKMRAKMFADKLDVYIGTGLGYKMSYTKVGDFPSQTFHTMFLDFHVGVRYQISDRVGIFAEVGNGQSTFNMGVAIKIGLPKKQKPIKTF